jgi:hypothetical protein
VGFFFMPSVKSELNFLPAFAGSQISTILDNNHFGTGFQALGLMFMFSFLRVRCL